MSTSSDRARVMGISALVAFVGGGAVSLLAFLIARYGPQADGWSFRGNGALAVYPFFLPVLTAGWTALVLRARGHPRWLALGAAAGAVGVAMAFLAAAILPLFGRSADQALSPAIYVALLVWMFAAPVLAAWRHVRSWPIAALTWFVGAVAGLFVVGLIIPAGS